MFTQRSIAISGDLGSGKSTVAALLSQRLCLEKISLGDIHREMAGTRGLSALQMNRHSERDAGIDAYVDGVQRRPYGRSPRPPACHRPSA
ncbi:cytidylate kinase family protein [Nonomuraea insulae]|uniref:Cytidylate kinase family protein n=1 Tax=Nonomuraea insulae TaxID=1616787 RepID=A0ABW1CNS1_9ACTN